MEKKKRIVTVLVMLVVYFLIHILFIKDGTLTIIGLIAILVHAFLNLRIMGWFAVAGYPLGYLLGVLADTPSDIGTLPNNLYVIWMFVFIGVIVVGVCVDIYTKMKARKEE